MLKRGRYHITYRCNLECPFCLTNSTAEGSYEASLEKLFPTFRKMAEAGVNYFSITGGEPFLVYDKLIETVRFVKSLGVKDIRVFTNGTLITPEKIKSLSDAGCNGYHISVDGMKDEHDKLRGAGNWGKTIRAIDMLSGAGVYLRIVCLVHKSNWQDASTLVDLLSPKVDMIQFRNINKMVGRGKEYDEQFDIRKLFPLVGSQVVIKEHGNYRAYCDNISVQPDGKLMTCGQTQEQLGTDLNHEALEKVKGLRDCRLREIDTYLNGAGEVCYGN